MSSFDLSEYYLNIDEQQLLNLYRKASPEDKEKIKETLEEMKFNNSNEK